MKKRIRGLNPTIKQAMVLQQNGIDYREYLIKRVFRDRLECIHKSSGVMADAYFNAVGQ